MGRLPTKISYSPNTVCYAQKRHRVHQCHVACVILSRHSVSCVITASRIQAVVLHGRNYVQLRFRTYGCWGGGDDFRPVKNSTQQTAMVFERIWSFSLPHGLWQHLKVKARPLNSIKVLYLINNVSYDESFMKHIYSRSYVAIQFISTVNLWGNWKGKSKVIEF